MNLDGIGGYGDTITTLSSLSKQKESMDATTKTTNETTSDEAAVYEKSTETTPKKTTYTQNTAVIDQLKADAEARTSQLKSLVESMFTKQGKTYDEANFWNAIRQGDYEVDPETAAQAAKDIAEDGYWGVTQTSGRILSFAKALTGGDPSKIEDMRAAVEEGFKEATKSWGDTLPDISSKTYDAIMKGFDDWASQGQ